VADVFISFARSWHPQDYPARPVYRTLPSYVECEPPVRRTRIGIALHGLSWALFSERSDVWERPSVANPCSAADAEHPLGVVLHRERSAAATIREMVLASWLPPQDVYEFGAGEDTAAQLAASALNPNQGGIRYLCLVCAKWSLPEADVVSILALLYGKGSARGPIDLLIDRAAAREALYSLLLPCPAKARRVSPCATRMGWAASGRGPRRPRCERTPRPWASSATVKRKTCSWGQRTDLGA